MHFYAAASERTSSRRQRFERQAHLWRMAARTKGPVRARRPSR